MTCARRGSWRPPSHFSSHWLHPCGPEGNVSLLAWQERDVWGDLWVPLGPCRPVDWKKQVCYLRSEFLCKEQLVVICTWALWSSGAHSWVLPTPLPPPAPLWKVLHKWAPCSSGQSVQRAVLTSWILSNGQSKVPGVLSSVRPAYRFLIRRLKWKAREVLGLWRVQ